MKYKLIFKSGKKRYLRHFLFMMTQIINKIWRTLHQQCHQLWIKQQQSVNKSSWSVEESKNFGRGQEVYYLDSWILLVMAWNCLSVVRKSTFCSSYFCDYFCHFLNEGAKYLNLVKRWPELSQFSGVLFQRIAAPR